MFNGGSYVSQFRLRWHPLNVTAYTLQCTKPHYRPPASRQIRGTLSDRTAPELIDQSLELIKSEFGLRLPRFWSREKNRLPGATSRPWYRPFRKENIPVTLRSCKTTAVTPTSLPALGLTG